MASPLLLSAIISAFVYYSDPGTTRAVIAFTILLIGFIAGVFLATKAWKTKGTNNFLSEINSSPDFDNFRDSEKTNTETDSRSLDPNKSK